MSSEKKNCPYCGEEILAVAKKCKHCGEWLDDEHNKDKYKEKINETINETIEKTQEAINKSSKIFSGITERIKTFFKPVTDFIKKINTFINNNRKILLITLGPVSFIVILIAYLLEGFIHSLLAFVGCVLALAFGFIMLKKGFFLRIFFALFLYFAMIFATDCIREMILSSEPYPQFYLENVFIFSICAVVTWVLNILLDKAFNYIKSNITFEDVKIFISKPVSLVVISLLVMSGIIATFKSFQVPTCDSKYAEKTVISIFKNNDNIYKNNIDNVSTIKMSSFIPEGRDKETGKNTCSARLTMYAKSGTTIFFLLPFNSFKYNVYYEIYKERGNNRVKASWEMLNIGNQDVAN